MTGKFGGCPCRIAGYLLRGIIEKNGNETDDYKAKNKNVGSDTNKQL